MTAEDSSTSLRAVLEDAVRELEATEQRTGPEPDAVEWSIGGRLYAAVAGETAEFRLDPAVAAAALRTPDTSASDRGRDWVAFAPPELDRHAIDRATAWLASAWRRADGEA